MDKPKLVFFGNERLSSGYKSRGVVLQSLIDAGYDIAAVVAHHGETASRSERSLEIAAIAEKAHIPVLTPNKPGDIAEELSGLGADAAVLAAYGRIIPSNIINLFPKGIINIHPSLLPKYRGPTPIEQAILDGTRETGVSIMLLTPEMDAGPVFAQKALTLQGTETKQGLTDDLVELGCGLLLETLPNIIDGSLEAISQQSTDATYCSLITKANGRIDWTKSAVQIEREIRAYAGWPKSYTKLGSVDVAITKAHTILSSSENPGTIEIDNDTQSLMIHAGDGYLCIDSLIPAGKKEMPIKAFLNGYRDKISAQAA